MIKLKKLDKPAILVRNATTWTSVFIGKVSAKLEPTPTESNRYRHPEVKAVLIAETHGKCAYCESKLLHIHHGDVEHIIPKSLAPEKRFEWENLTLACEVCNQKKSDKDPFIEHIIDPYITDPAQHLVFTGPIIFPLGTEEGRNTQILLDLNRPALVERRKEHLDHIMKIIDLVLNKNLPLVTRKSIYTNLKMNEAADNSAYAAMVRSVIDAVAKNFPSEITLDSDN